MAAEVIGLVATYDLTGFIAGGQEHTVSTPWGDATYILGRLADQPVALLQRYGPGMEMVQHLVNFRANIWGFHELGVRRIIATDGVGSLRRDLAPGTFAVVHDFLDFTQRGPFSFFEEHGCSVRVDVTDPFCPDVRSALVVAARQADDRAQHRGVLAAFAGPRFETPAEGRMAVALGADVIGTMLIPEIVLAREAEICYALLAIVINYGPDLAPRTERRGPGSMEEMYFTGPHRLLPDILREAFTSLPSERRCPCARAVPQTAFGRLPAWYQKRA
jgi:5'-methylthioadenosine phosphorylase